MVTTRQKKKLQKILDLSDDPEMTFSCDELLGYMFGLAMTPDVVVPSEWLPLIFGGDTPTFGSEKQMQDALTSLMDLYNSFTGEFQKNQLQFPYSLDQITSDQFQEIYEWVSGFEEALALRDYLWDPEEHPKMSEQRQAELYHSMMTVQGLVDSVEAMEYFEEMPQEVFRETFAGLDLGEVDRQTRVQLFLMATLPLAVETLMEHARFLEKRRQRSFGRSSAPVPLRAMKIGRNDPCPCNSGRKYKKCCGSGGENPAFSSEDMTGRKSNVIKVDFPQHHKKKRVPVPVYQLKVGIHRAKPPIWRRLQVPGDLPLDQLHEVIQIAMGWANSHLHQFVIDKTCYGPPTDDDFLETDSIKNEANFTLHSLKDKIGSKFRYIYDFGDNWEHLITVEKTLPAEEGPDRPRVLTGRRTCPPEDAGGIHEYMRVLEILEDPDDQEYETITSWLGTDSFDPAGFGKEDVVDINDILEGLFPPARK